MSNSKAAMGRCGAQMLIKAAAIITLSAMCVLGLIDGKAKTEKRLVPQTKEMCESFPKVHGVNQGWAECQKSK